MARSACLPLLLGLIFAAFGAPAQSGLGETDSGDYVVVTGRADDSLAGRDKAEAAKLDACRKALLDVAPVYVESRSLTSFHQLVSNYNYTEVRGLIERAVAVGDAVSADKVYSQKYRVKVNKGPLRIEIWKKKVDLKLLYEAAERPRLCLAITDFDAVAGRNGSETASPSRSHDRIITYFKKQQPDFVFKDLLLLGASPEQISGLLSESGKNSFDLLVYGTTRRTVTPGPKDFADGTHIVFGGADRVTWNVEWRVIDVKNQETLFHVENPDPEAASPDEPASRYPLLDQAAAELFRQLLVHWSRSSTVRALEVSFESSEPPDPLALVSGLKQTEGLDPQSIQLGSWEKGRVTYHLNATRTLPEIIGSLGKVFAKDYKIYSGRPGQIRLTAVQSVEIAVTVKGASLSLLSLVQSQLSSSPVVQSVRRQSFESGVARLVLTTHAPAEDIGALLETIRPNQLVVRGLTPSTIDVETK